MGKTFKYLAPPLQPWPTDLETPNLVGSQSFHFLASPEDMEKHVAALLALREQHGVPERPLIVWKPAPLTCKRVHLESHLRACKVVDVFSPNHSELGASVEDEKEDTATFSKAEIERCARRFLEAVAGGIVVIRCGEHGCYTLSLSAA
ncbi:Fc.00g051800.m01.CDS01 [Cosmosporella sp. VM-42]